MKIAAIFAGMFLACSAITAGAAELALFGQELRTVDRASLRNAAQAAGAKLSSTAGATDYFNVDAVGVPGAKTLEVVYLNNQVVLAQYKLEKTRADEGFRKMLVAKYGYPHSVNRGYVGPILKKFDQQYISDGKYRWEFDNGMELVFAKEFFGERYLTYVNKPVQAEMERRLEAVERNRAGQAARVKSDVF